MKRFLALSAVLSATLGLISCEQHSWDEETKRLYPSHDHGEHAADGDHAKKDAEKKSEHKHDHDHADHGSHSH